MKAPQISEIREYWNNNIHDAGVATHPAGTPGYFKDLEAYRFSKLDYLPRLVNFSAYSGKRILEVGCGVGIDLLRFAQAGAEVVGVDLSKVAIDLARRNFALSRLQAELHVMDGEALEFTSESFDVVYSHGVLQYTSEPAKMILEIYRVLRPGGEAILMVYNKFSWLNLLSFISRVELEHQDAPALRKFSVGEFKRMLAPFSKVSVIPDRFPVKTQLHHGWKAALYNEVFVRSFNLLPRSWVQPFGWHLLAFAHK